jgi:uncharacterized MAPEG superfamily protein
MSTDLKYLAFTAILTASLWIPYIVCQVMTNGGLTPKNYLDPAPRPVPLWGLRANRAHQNAVVLAIHVAGKANSMTAYWAMAFFWLRLAHALVYLLGTAYLRTLLFTLSYIAVLGLFWELIK